MARPSVLFMNRIYPPYRGATGRVLQELARSFVKKKWDVSIVTSGPKASRYKDGPIEIITVKGPQKPGAMISYIWVWLKMLGVALCLRRRDLLVTMTDPPLLVVVGALIVRIKRMRHIHWCQDLFPDILPAIDVKMPGFLMRFYKRAAYRAMNKCEKVIVIGRCMARHMAYNGIDPRHITVIPNWPNFELVRVKSKKSYNELKRDHEEQNEGKAAENLFKSPVKFRVLYAGNLGKAHPVDTIIEAAALLQKEHPEIEFVFVGDGPRFDHIARERARRELDNIRLIPYQPPAYLKKIMESGDLHLISMKEEAAGFLVSSKLYSALAVQRPCIFIGPEQSETAKVIRDFAAGTTVHQEDAEGLAHAIKTYRMDSDAWFAAHHGAAEAGKVFVPNEAIKAWIKRADAVVTAAGAAGDIKARKSA